MRSHSALVPPDLMFKTKVILSCCLWLRNFGSTQLSGSSLEPLVELPLDIVWSWKSRVLLELGISLYHSPSHSLRDSPCSSPLRLDFLTVWQPQDCLHGGSGSQRKYSSKQGVSYITFDDLPLEVPQSLPFVFITNESQAHPPRFKGRGQRPYLSAGGVSRS